MIKKLLAEKLVPASVLLVRKKANSDAVYLTFDDGPDPEVTPAVLDILAKYSARASFFCVGQRLQEHPELSRRIVSEGHLLGNHSFHHRGFGRLSLAEQWAEIRKTDNIISEFTQKPSRYFRAPQGILPLPLFVRLAISGKTTAHWSMDSKDFAGGDAKDISKRLLQMQPVGGDVILLHDDNMICCEILEQIMPVLMDQGLRFQAIDS